MHQQADISRRLESLIRLGTVAQVDESIARCRIQSGNLLTDWLPWLAVRAGQTKAWNPPTEGEQVILLSPSGETAAGVALVGLYSDANPAPSDSAALHIVVYPNGARITYDHEAGALTATGIKSALIDAADSITAKAGQDIHAQAGASVTVQAQRITLDAPQTTVTGLLTVQGLLTYQAGMAGSGSAPGGGSAIIHGPVSVQGPVTVDGDIHASGAVMDGAGNSNHHTHP